MSDASPPPSGPYGLIHASNPGAVGAFRALRTSVETGPLDAQTIELILVASLTTSRDYPSMRVHVRRALELGVEPAALEEAVIATLGASTVFAQVVAGLEIIKEEVHPQ